MTLAPAKFTASRRSQSSATGPSYAMTGPMPWLRSPELWRPHLGQRKGVKFLLEHACAGLFADPGCGKTSIVLAAFKFLKKKGLANKMLVVAPLRVCHMVWPAELKKWTDFYGLRMVVLHGDKKDNLLAEDADIYVVNYEGLDWLLDAQRVTNARGRIAVTVDLKKFKARGFDTLCMDELSRLKNHASGRHKALKEVLGTFSRRWGLTGSPAANGLLDLFGEIYMLDMGRSFGPYITHYRARYFVPGHDGFSWDLQKGAAPLIYERIAPLVCRLAAADYVDMPEMVINDITFDLPKAVRGIYDDMEEEMLTVLNNKAIVADTMGIASNKCRQIANGGLYVDEITEGDLTKIKGATRGYGDGRQWVNFHNCKVDILESLLGDLEGQPLFVAYEYHHDLDRLRARFGKDVPVIGGGTTTKRALDLEKLWNAGKLPLLFGHPQSVGHGLNFQEAGNHVAFHSMTYDFDTYDQFIRRVWRQGNNFDRVFVHRIMARNTFDQVMGWALGHKERTQTALLDAMREFSKTRK
jgi:hypothetical protein